MLPLLFTLLLAGPARADEPLTGPQRKAAAEARAAADAAKEADEGAGADMSACSTPEEAVTQLRTAASKQAYDCLITADGADAAILAALETLPLPPADQPAADGERNRLTRALALYDIARLDVGISDDHVRALAAADRRLVRDAVYARRGRKSPSEEHEGVFEKLGWYQPDPKFTNARLTAADLAVIDKLDHPPALPEPEKPESAADAMAAAAAPSEAPKGGLCSCAASPAAPVFSLLLPLLVVARRRR